MQIIKTSYEKAVVTAQRGKCLKIKYWHEGKMEIKL